MAPARQRSPRFVSSLKRLPMDGMKSPPAGSASQWIHRRSDGCAGYGAMRIELFEHDLAIQNQMQAGLTQRQCDLDRQLLLAGEAAFGNCRPYRVLDFALRGDSELLEELPHAHVEDAFVHGLSFRIESAQD